MYAVNFDELQWESPISGARFKSFSRDGKMLRIAEFTSEFVEPHWCEKGHVGIVLSGGLEIDSKVKWFAIQRGRQSYSCRDCIWSQRPINYAHCEAIPCRGILINIRPETHLGIGK